MATATNSKDFLSLSTEILHSICNSLTPQDVANFRRAARKYAGVGYEHIFRHYKIRLRLRKDYFEQLWKLSTNNSACHAIRTLEIHGSITDFRDGIYGLRGKDGMVERIYLKKELQESLKRLPSLHTIKFRTSTYGPGEGSGNLRPATSVVHQMEHLIRDVQSCSDLNLKHLSFQDFFQGSSTLPSLKAGVGFNELLQMSFCASRLTRLDLILSPLNHHYAADQLIAFADFLKSTHKLEELVLDFRSQEAHGINRVVDDRPIYFDLICKAHLGHFRKVAISGGSVPYHRMLAFFEKHTSLTEVRMHSVQLREGDWATLMNKMAVILPDISALVLSGEMRCINTRSESTWLCGDHLNMHANEHVVRKLPNPIVSYRMSSIEWSTMKVVDQIEQRARRQAGRECCPCNSCGLILDH